MNAYKFLLSNIFWLLAARSATRIVALLFLPIRTAYLSPKDFGIIVMFEVTSTFLSGFYGMGVLSFASRIIYKYERVDRQKCKENLGLILIYLVLFSLVGVIISSVMIENIFRLFFKEIVLPHRIFYYVPVIMAFMKAIHDFTTNNFTSLQLNKRLFVLEMTMFILFFPTQIVGLIFFKFSVWDVIILQLVVQGIVLCMGLWLIKGWVSFSGNLLRIFNETMRYSTPLALLNFTGWLQQSIDKILLNKITTLDAVGVYSAGLGLASNYSFLSRPIATVIKPEISKSLDANDPNVQRNIREFFMFFFQISIFLYLAISLFSKDIVELLFNERFHEAYRIVPITVLGLIFGELAGIFELKIFFRNMTVWFPIMSGIGVLINAVLNYLLIPGYGIYGAAFAASTTALIIMFLYYSIAQRLHRSEYNIFKNFIPLLAIIGGIFIVNYSGLNGSSAIVLKITLLIVYGVILDYILRKRNTRYRELRNIIITTLSAKLKYC